MTNQPAHDRYNSEVHPARPFGSALSRDRTAWTPIVPPTPITVRPVKPSACGPCKVCGERRFFCECEDEQ